MGLWASPRPPPGAMGEHRGPLDPAHEVGDLGRTECPEPLEAVSPAGGQRPGHQGPPRGALRWGGHGRATTRTGRAEGGRKTHRPSAPNPAALTVCAVLWVLREPLGAEGPQRSLLTVAQLPARCFPEATSSGYSLQKQVLDLIPTLPFFPDLRRRLRLKHKGRTWHRTSAPLFRFNFAELL